MSENARSPEAFTHPVFIEIDAEWICVEDAMQSQGCLTARFRDQSGASFKRALEACDAAIRRTGPVEMARVTLVVAAMEAGYRFEIIGDDAEAFERKIELETETALRSILDPSLDI